MYLKEIAKEIERMETSKIILRDPVQEDYVPVSVIAAKVGISGQKMNEFLEKAGFITKQKITFKRPIEKVKHPKRHKWLVMPRHRYLLEDGSASENCGPYKHSIHWKNCEETEKFFRAIKKMYS